MVTIRQGLVRCSLGVCGIEHRQGLMRITLKIGWINKNPFINLKGLSRLSFL